MGTYFDDGGNFGSSYDTHFNDYPMIAHGFTLVIAQTRAAFGDINPPSYDYWGGRLMKGGVADRAISQFYIACHWIIWLS